jgi:hypothetical protein
MKKQPRFSEATKGRKTARPSSSRGFNPKSEIQIPK